MVLEEPRDQRLGSHILDESPGESQKGVAVIGGEGLSQSFHSVELEGPGRVLVVEEGLFHGKDLVGQPKHVEVAEILTEELGSQVTAREESLEIWSTRMEATALGEYQRSTLIKMFEYYAKNGFKGNDLVLRHLLQREPTSFRSFVQRVMTEL